MMRRLQRGIWQIEPCRKGYGPAVRQLEFIRSHVYRAETGLCIAGRRPAIALEVAVRNRGRKSIAAVNGRRRSQQVIVVIGWADKLRVQLDVSVRSSRVLADPSVRGRPGE